MGVGSESEDVNGRKGVGPVRSHAPHRSWRCIVDSSQLTFGGIRNPGPGFLPCFAGATLMILSGYCMVKGLLVEKKEKVFHRSIMGVVIVVTLLILYVLVLRSLGYFLATFVLLVFLFKIGGFRRWAFVVLGALLTVSINYLVFSYWLSIRFPRGVLGF